MKESDIQREFMKTYVPFGAYELKLSKHDSIPYNAVKEHQIAGLRKAKSPDGLFYKINDMPAFAGSMTRFSNPKPFDCFRMRAEKAYVAICFYIPRQKKELLCIDVDEFVFARDNDKRKSLTKDKAYQISDIIITL